MFRRSSFCRWDPPQCVEVAVTHAFRASETAHTDGDHYHQTADKDRAEDAVHVRDSKTGRMLTFTPAEWQAFIEGVRAGEFDLAALGIGDPARR